MEEELIKIVHSSGVITFNILYELWPFTRVTKAMIEAGFKHSILLQSMEMEDEEYIEPLNIMPPTIYVTMDNVRKLGSGNNFFNDENVVFDLNITCFGYNIYISETCVNDFLGPLEDFKKFCHVKASNHLPTFRRD
jgi:hypothetical protein